MQMTSRELYFSVEEEKVSGSLLKREDSDFVFVASFDHIDKLTQPSPQQLNTEYLKHKMYVGWFWPNWRMASACLV